MITPQDPFLQRTEPSGEGPLTNQAGSVKEIHRMQMGCSVPAASESLNPELCLTAPEALDFDDPTDTPIWQSGVLTDRFSIDGCL